MLPSPRQWSVIIFGALVVALLIGTRLGAVFAGGPGYFPPLSASTVETFGNVTESRAGHERFISANPPRGSVIETDKGARALLDIDGTIIGVYEDTRVELKTLSHERVELYLPKGRVAVSTVRAPDRKVTISTNQIDATTIGGDFSVVNYDFQQRVSVIPLLGIVSVAYNQDKGDIISAPIDITETDPMTVTQTTFTLEGGVAEEFYRWFLDATIVETPPDRQE